LVKLSIQVIVAVTNQSKLTVTISCFLSNLLEVILFETIKSPNDELVIECIKCVSEVFHKEPNLVIKAYESDFDF